MKKTKLIPLTINRAKWARGGYNGDSMLLNSKGNMCCLGFACRVVGIPANKLKGIGTPQTVTGVKALTGKLGKMVEAPSYAKSIVNSDDTDAAVGVNDDDKISDKMREYKLKPILKKLGFAAKFVGPTRPISDD